MANFAGGFDETFVDPPDDECQCPICLLVARNPILTRCGHAFCEVCFSQLKREGEWVFCPEDRQKLGRSDTFPHNMLKRKILQMLVKCREHASGCEKILNLQYLEEHLAVCDYVVVSCPYECDEIMPRSALAKHEREWCLRRQVQHCYTPMEFQEIKDHQLQVCTELPVTCRLCSKRMARSKIDGHCSVRGDCPKTVIDCEYKDIGCQFKYERELLSAHLQEGMGKHMKLLHQNHEELKEKQVKEREEIQLLHQNYKKLRKQQVKERDGFLEEIQLLHKHIQLLHKENKELKEHFMDEMKNHKKDLQLLKHQHMDEVKKHKEDVRLEREQHSKEMQEIKEEIRQYRSEGFSRKEGLPYGATKKKDCMICSEFITFTNRRSLPCGHAFCKLCIDACLKRRPKQELNSCPVCGITFRKQTDMVDEEASDEGSKEKPGEDKENEGDDALSLFQVSDYEDDIDLDWLK